MGFDELLVVEYSQCVGILLKAWSNGRLHNVKHRVMCKEAKPRVSIALFLLVPEDGDVEPAAAFVDSAHPRLYRTFNYEEYRKLLVSTKSFTGEALSLLAADHQASEKTKA